MANCTPRGKYRSSTLNSKNPLSALLLRLSAYLSNQGICFELFRYTRPNDPDWVQSLGQSELEFNSAVRVLVDHGLMEPSSREQEQQRAGDYAVHKCVQS